MGPFFSFFFLILPWGFLLFLYIKLFATNFIASVQTNQLPYHSSCSYSNWETVLCLFPLRSLNKTTKVLEPEISTGYAPHCNFFKMLFYTQSLNCFCFFNLQLNLCLFLCTLRFYCMLLYGIRYIMQVWK